MRQHIAQKPCLQGHKHHNNYFKIPSLWMNVITSGLLREVIMWSCLPVIILQVLNDSFSFHWVYYRIMTIYCYAPQSNVAPLNAHSVMCHLPIHACIYVTLFCQPEIFSAYTPSHGLPSGMFCSVKYTRIEFSQLLVNKEMLNILYKYDRFS